MSPRYLKIAEALQARRRTLASPQRLPDEFGMASEFNVGRDTIRRALKVLEENGAVTRRRGAGTLLHPVVAEGVGLEGKVVGIIPPWWADSTSAWFTSVVFEGLSQWAEEHCCLLTVLHAEPKPREIDAWIESCHTRKIAGLISVHPQSHQMPLIEKVAKIFPTIVLGRVYPGRGLHHVSPDYEHAAELVNEHLASLGHDHYAVVLRSVLEDYSRTWVDVFARARRLTNDEFDYRTHVIDFHSFPEFRLPHILAKDHAPYCPENIQAYVLVMSSYLRSLLADDEFRRRMQKELTVVAFDFGLQAIDTYWPGHSITHVTCDWAKMGHRAMELLAVLASNGSLPEVVLEPVWLNVGDTSYQFDSTIQNNSAFISDQPKAATSKTAGYSLVKG